MLGDTGFSATARRRRLPRRGRVERAGNGHQTAWAPACHRALGGHPPHRSFLGAEHAADLLAAPRSSTCAGSCWRRWTSRARPRTQSPHAGAGGDGRPERRRTARCSAPARTCTGALPPLREFVSTPGRGARLDEQGSIRGVNRAARSPSSGSLLARTRVRSARRAGAPIPILPR